MTGKDYALIGVIGATGILGYYYMPQIREWLDRVVKPPWEEPEPDRATFTFGVVNPNVYRHDGHLPAQVWLQVNTISAKVFDQRCRLQLRAEHDWRDGDWVDIYVPSGRTEEYVLPCSVSSNWDDGQLLDFRLEIKGTWTNPLDPFDRPGTYKTEPYLDRFTVVGGE